MKKQINAEIIADSISPQGHRAITYILTYPRFIHAELLTHRLFSRNAASSRAIPFDKMASSVEEDPVIPVAWQKAHKGMQGTEYFTEPLHLESTEERWLDARDSVVEIATDLSDNYGITKQICNRLLEPFQWYTCLVTATEYDNFFELRSPKYNHEGGNFKSWTDLRKSKNSILEFLGLKNIELIERLSINKGAGEIHISLLAEAMWDAKNESKPDQLKPGEWHIPFLKHLDYQKLGQAAMKKLDVSNGQTYNVPAMIATARSARVSYNNFEGTDNYEKDIDLYNRLLKDRHMSPFEHCMQIMSDKEYNAFTHTKLVNDEIVVEKGWCNNVRGFIPLRFKVEHE